MFSIQQLTMILAFTPMLGALVAGLGAKRIGVQGAHIVTIAGVLVAFLAACQLVYLNVFQADFQLDFTLYRWLVSGDSVFQVGFLVDRLSVLMSLVVTFIALLVHVYSMGYMHGDAGYQRFFSYVSLFTFAMLMLVMANNGMQLFFGWEGVGVVSYLLIGFGTTKTAQQLEA